ncbi:MAG: AroM family protein [Candidatus Bathyarchaeia archaeon]
MALTIGMVTIGQSPRTDIIPDMRRILGPEPRILECGALDGLTLEEVRKLAPKPGGYVLVSLMRDGTEVMLDRDLLINRIQACIDRLTDKGADLIVILCTGEFPEFSSKKPLIEPSRILYSLVASLMRGGRLGVMVPSPGHVQEMRDRWRRTGLEVSIEPASPYVKGDEIAKAAKKLQAQGVDLVIMDCMGYDEEMTERVRRMTGKPVICPHSLTARIVKELI